LTTPATGSATEHLKAHWRGEHVLEAHGVYLRISPERFGEPGVAWRNPFWKPPGAVMRKASIGVLADLPALAKRIARDLGLSPPAQERLI
jgi:hypothetical protein